MNHDYLWYVLAGLSGFVFHCIMKCKSLNDDAVAANLEFRIFRDYIMKDRFGLALSFISPLVWLLLFGEIAALYPKVLAFAITSFFVMGALGSYVIQYLLSQAKKKIRQRVDDATNELDKIKGKE